jgi:transposase
MVLTVLVGILINNAVGKSNMAGLKSEIQRVEGILTSELKRAEGELKSEVKRIEGELKSELKRIEGVLGAKIDALTVRIKALEDEIHSPLVKR